MHAHSRRSSGSNRCSFPQRQACCPRSGSSPSEERRDRVVSYLCPLADAGELPAEGTADLRYRGQSFELSIPLQPGLAQAFHRAHEERYGYADASREIELVAVRTAEVVPGPNIAFGDASPLEVAGPVVLELTGATCWVPDGWHGATNGDGTLVLTR